MARAASCTTSAHSEPLGMERFAADAADAAAHGAEAAAEPLEEVLARTASQLDAYQKLEDILRRLESREGDAHEVISSSKQTQAGGSPAEAERGRKRARAVGEDLVEAMLALDGLSRLAPEDRRRRKAALAAAEALLGEVDEAKLRLAAAAAAAPAAAASEAERAPALATAEAKADAPMSGSGDDDDDDESLSRGSAAAPAGVPPQSARTARTPAAAPAVPVGVVPSPQSARAAPAPITAPPALPAPRPGLWRDVPLRARFDAWEEPGRYVLAARMPGLQASDVRVERTRRGGLSVAGCRAPSPREAEALRRALAARLRRLAEGSAERLRRIEAQLPQLADEAYAEMGQGEFGRFAETFTVPSDVDTDGIAWSCDGGELRVTLPKARMMSARRGQCATPRGLEHPAFGGLRAPFWW